MIYVLTASRVTGLFNTPLIRSLSKAHVEHIRNSTTKSLMDEYNSTFSSKKTPLTDKRRSIANITLDIIKQRVENINRNASFNQSSNDLLDGSFHSLKSTPVPATVSAARDNNDNSTLTNTTTPVLDAGALTTNGQGSKPLKRKLFTAPPVLFPEMDKGSTSSTLLKTDKKTATQKRKRNDVPAAGDKLSKSDEKKTSVAKTTKPSRKTINPRRSTLLFEDAPIRQINQNGSNSTTSTTTDTLTNATIIRNTEQPKANAPGLVFTSMHQPQIDFINEVRHG